MPDAAGASSVCDRAAWAIALNSRSVPNAYRTPRWSTRTKHSAGASGELDRGEQVHVVKPVVLQRREPGPPSDRREGRLGVLGFCKINRYDCQNELDGIPERVVAYQGDLELLRRSGASSGRASTRPVHAAADHQEPARTSPGSARAVPPGYGDGAFGADCNAARSRIPLGLPHPVHASQPGPAVYPSLLPETMSVNVAVSAGS